MIYELTTYQLKPRSVPQAEDLFAAAYATRSRHSPLVGAFHTEFGPLNQIVHIWKYDDMAQRERVAAQVEEEDAWPPAIGEYLVSANTAIMAPVSFSRELKPGRLGPYFELRTYTYPLGTLATMMRAWERAMPMRDALGAPVAAVWVNRIGPLDTLTHLWPYQSLQQREDIRRKVRETGMWPPFKLDEAEGGSGYEILGQSNKLMLPAAFSPLQ